MASTYNGTSSPALWAYSMPSHIPSIVLAIPIWFAILQCCPAPGPPSLLILPMHSRSGATASTAGSSPPAKMVSVPFLAPMSPPDTGQSSAAQPFEVAAAAISTASAGSEVVMSTMMPPGLRFARMPSSPRMTDRTSEGYPTMVNTTSEFLATSPGELASTAPWSRGRRVSAQHRQGRVGPRAAQSPGELDHSRAGPRQGGGSEGGRDRAGGRGAHRVDEPLRLRRGAVVHGRGEAPLDELPAHRGAHHPRAHPPHARHPRLRRR